MNKSNSWQSLKDNFKDLKPTPSRSRNKNKRPEFHRQSPMKWKPAIQPLPLFVNESVPIAKAEKENSISRSNQPNTPFKRSADKSPTASLKSNLSSSSICIDCDSDSSDGDITYDPDYEDVPRFHRSMTKTRRYNSIAPTAKGSSDENQATPVHKTSRIEPVRKPLTSLRAGQTKKDEELENRIADSDDVISATPPSGNMFDDPENGDTPRSNRSTTRTQKWNSLVFTIKGSDNRNLTTPLRKPTSIRRKSVRQSFPCFRANLSAEQETLENSIVFSDSDDENSVISATPTNDEANNAKRRRVVESTPAISVVEPSQSDFFIDTQSSGRTIPVASQQLIDATVPRVPAKRPKYKKGSLMERLHNSLNNTKSDLSFWINERQSNMIKSGEMVRIESIDRTYGRALVYCRCENGETRILCLSPSHRKLASMQVDQTIEVEFADAHPYKIEDRLTAFTGVNKIMF